METAVAAAEDDNEASRERAAKVKLMKENASLSKVAREATERAERLKAVVTRYKETAESAAEQVMRASTM